MGQTVEFAAGSWIVRQPPGYCPHHLTTDSPEIMSQWRGI